MIFLKAFLVGGLICGIVQILIDKTKLTLARILVGLVVLGVVLGALGLYQPLWEFAEEGAGVPLLGFGANMVDEKGLLGVLLGPMTAAAGGITASMACGVIASIVAKPKDKA